MSLPLLSLVTFVPLAGVLAILLMPSANNARWIALITTVVTFVLSLLVWINFNPANPGFQLVEKYNWLGGGISYHMGVDGISMLFVVLTAGLMPFCIAARVLDASRGAVRLQSGYVYHYALAMLLGVVALATWFMVSGGGL